MKGVLKEKNKIEFWFTDGSSALERLDSWHYSSNQPPIGRGLVVYIYIYIYIYTNPLALEVQVRIASIDFSNSMNEATIQLIETT